MSRPRFLLFILVIPFVAAAVLTFAFLSQVIQLDARQWWLLALLWVITYGTATVAFFARITPEVSAVIRASDSDAMSNALSRCLSVTSTISNLAWLGGGAIFTLLASTLVLPELSGVTSFAAVSFLTATLCISFVYGAAKRILAHAAGNMARVHYTGRELPVARKLAVIFIGVFLASIVALIDLVAARVSSTLEQQAITAAEKDFASSFDIARESSHVTNDELQRLDMYLASKYVFFVVDRDGRVRSSQPRSGERLDGVALRRIQVMRSGDSASFVAPQVLRFAELRDGSILVMRIPWDTYREVPRQILFYALIVGVLTLITFAAATYFLASDLTAPLRRLRELSLQLADGNFSSDISIFTDDEISAVAASAAVTRDNLRALIGEVGGSGASIATRVRMMSGGSQSLIDAAQRQSSLANASSEALNDVREGAEVVLQAAESITHRATAATSDAGQLALSATSIAHGMTSLFESVKEISNVSTTIGDAAAEMAVRTGTMASATEDVVAYVAQMDATIEELRRTAIETAALSRQVDTNASAGVSAVARTLDGIETARRSTDDAAGVMRQLDESTKQIVQMLAIIEQVASRTNLLSLNAAIIAAQAGSQGAGFQVVAEEIRTLADETRHSTKEIAMIVNGIRKNSRGAIDAIEIGVARVEESVALARDASSALNVIQESAASSLSMSETTTRALDEQARSARHLHGVVTEFTTHVAEIDRGTRDHAHAVASLQHETERVHGIALDVQRATSLQSSSASAITNAMAALAGDIETMRDRLATQLRDTERIATASHEILGIARENDRIATEFGGAVDGLVSTGHDFERVVHRFRM